MNGAEQHRNAIYFTTAKSMSLGNGGKKSVLLKKII